MKIGVAIPIFSTVGKTPSCRLRFTRWHRGKDSSFAASRNIQGGIWSGPFALEVFRFISSFSTSGGVTILTLNCVARRGLFLRFLFSHGFHMLFPRERTRCWRLDPIVEKNVQNELAIRDLSLTLFIDFHHLGHFRIFCFSREDLFDTTPKDAWFVFILHKNVLTMVRLSLTDALCHSVTKFTVLTPVCVIICMSGSF